jgi:magnesium chelatase family protein
MFDFAAYNEPHEHMENSMSAKVKSLADLGTSGLVVDIECHLSNNLPNIVLVGLAAKSVDESKERIRGAFSSSNLQIPRKRVTINLAPADIPKDSSSFDLPIAAAILSASGQLTKNLGESEAIIGELGLDGSIRPVRGIIGKLLAGRSNGIDTFYIPATNIDEAQLVPHITLIPLQSLKELYLHLAGSPELTEVRTGDGTAVTNALESYELTLGDIVGQHLAKRALMIAAAGGHNILLNGPPGTGKSMLARALPSILPRMDPEEILEVTHLHSLASREPGIVKKIRPFRAPHHSASHVAIVGGGNISRPGEITLAHRGVLFFDEFPEFGRATIEALRQPLEDRTITISRAHGAISFPADFILVATCNPCPCGFYGTAKPCECPAATIQRYRAKLSGPILDRIDLYTDVHEIDHANLLANRDDTQDVDAIRTTIGRAREMQSNRFSGPRTNATMTNRDIKSLACLSPTAKALLDQAGKALDLSARSYMRTIKVARTIADLSESKEISPDHVTEALSYRSRNFALSSS